MSVISKLTAVFLISLMFYSGVAKAQFSPPEPLDYSKTVISLMTVGRSTQLHARMGHSILRIQDFSNNMDYLANWGMFDFRDPLFIPKFLRGGLQYRMAFSPFDRTISYYRDVERRSVTEDELDLTDLQKKRLIEKIIWNARPENIYYSYQFFRNNCATKPRDYLDYALNGGLRAQLNIGGSGVSYRDYVWENMASNIFVGWILDAAFNGDTDVTLTKWDELFYPPKLRDHLRNSEAVDDNGQLSTGRKLVRARRVLVDLPEMDAAWIDGYQVTAMLSGLPMALVLLIFGLGLRRPVSAVLQSIQFRLFGLVSLWWGLTTGLLGIIHLVAWLFSSHTDLYHNINLILFWPLDWVVMIPTFGMMIRGRPFSPTRWLTIGFWQKFAQFHLVSALVYVVFAHSGLIHQNSKRVMIYMLPLSLLYYWLMLLFAKDAVKQNQ